MRVLLARSDRSTRGLFSSPLHPVGPSVGRMVAAHLVRYQDPEAKSQMGCNILSGVPATVGRSHIPAHFGRYERKLWMRDLVMGVAYPPVDH